MLADRDSIHQVLRSWWVDPSAGRSLFTYPLVTVVARDRAAANLIAGPALCVETYDQASFVALCLDSAAAQMRLSAVAAEGAATPSRDT